MTDLNVMMRETAMEGLRTKLDAAVTNGDTETARKVTDDIAKLSVQTAPKAPPFGNDDIVAQLQKTEWYGVDPKKSAKAGEFGKTMDPRKFATAAAFAEALVKAVDAEFAPPKAEKTDGDDDEPKDDEPKDDAVTAKPRKTDGPSDGDAGARNAAGRRTSSGPWTKLSDAPADVQKEIKRSADKFVSANAPKEQREKFINGALESHYAAAQRNKGKK